jgi:signal transduction histidine kinase
MWVIFIFLLFNKTPQWQEVKERDLWLFVVIQIVLLVPMTIIPGRIASADAHSRLQTLSQKQAFVRYVSHEIRSPLSIVSAGLEIFVERLNEEDITTPPLPLSADSALESAPPPAVGSPTSSNTSELLELANDLSEANDAAVNILNDLLQYESMDAGMFKLEAARVEPADLFKAKALTIIAKRHSLTLSVVQPAVEDGIFVLADVYRVEQVKK